MKFQVKLTEEAEKFIDSLPNKMQSKIKRSTDLLREFGYTLTEPHSKKLKSVEHLHELRVKVGSDICRLFYFFWKDKIYVVTSGYMKKSNKTEANQIDKAVKIMNEIKEG
jgi:phage-related protein